MGSCLSKKNSSSSSISSAIAAPPSDPISQPKLEEQKKIPPAEESVKKEIFVIKQRKSHEKHLEEKAINTTITTSTTTNIELEDSSSGTVVNGDIGTIVTAPIRTSSCTKEEVDAILIQCGRLSRSSSGKASAGGHKYSGSKRSYDFDQDYYDASVDNKKSGDEEEDKYHHHQSRPSHRRTPSREKKDFEYKRSGSRDRSSSSREEERKRNHGSRRSSRSPGRSETFSATATAGGPTPDKSRPGKMVSVPASVSRDKGIGGGGGGANLESTTTSVKRVSVKRSGEVGIRTVASPRSKSPANARAPNDNANYQQHPLQPVSLSRNSSRKAENSPYRRNPTNEIDENCLRIEQVSLKYQDHTSSNKATGVGNNKVQRIKEGVDGVQKKPSHLQSRKPDERKIRVVELPDGTTNNNSSQQESVMSCGAMKHQQTVQEPIEAKGLPSKNSEITVTVGSENLKPQTITRSRSSRRSRDLDLNLGFNPDTLLNPTSYASLLLEDIQNFHQQNTTAFSLPPCVTKACSILEAVADLNSCTSSNLSSAFSGDRCAEAGQSNNKNNSTVSSNVHLGKRRSKAKDPFVESEVSVTDDLLEPSLHKYVTLRRGATGGEMEQQESSGSNSFVGQHWVSSSWDPNSADSTDRWMSRSNTGEEVTREMEEPSLLGSQKQVFTEASTCDSEVGARRLRSSGNSTALPAVSLSGKK